MCSCRKYTGVWGCSPQEKHESIENEAGPRFSFARRLCLCNLQIERGRKERVIYE